MLDRTLMNLPIRILITTLALFGMSCGHTVSVGTELTEIRRVKSGNIEVVLLAPTDTLKQTRNYCTIEFRAGTDRHLVDVGKVTVRTTMTMDGQPMDGFVTDVKRVDPGRYEVQMVLAMTGDWTIAINWEDGAAPKGTATFAVPVH